MSRVQTNEIVHPKKILYLITGLDTGGAEVLLWQSLRFLDRTHFEPVVVSFIPIGEIGKRIEKDGVVVHSLNIRKVLSEQNKWNLVAFVPRFLSVLFIELPKLVMLVRRIQPDILHAHLFHANCIGRIVGTMCRVPIIISTIHNIDFGGRFRERVLQYTDFMSTRTIAISAAVEQAMLARKVVPSTKLTVIENGIDVDAFQIRNRGNVSVLRERLTLPIDRHIFVSVGRLQEQKGYAFLLEAARQLANEHTRVLFIVLGEGELRGLLEKEIMNQGLQDSVWLLGNRENVAEYLYASDSFVMPSLWEGLPIALLEAMACALPIVATRVGGVPDAVGNTAILVPPKDATALADACRKMLAQPAEQRAVLGSAMRQIVESRFSLQTNMQKYEQLYRSFTS